MIYTLHLTETQLAALSASAELLARLHMGQFSDLTTHLRVPSKFVSEFRADLENLKIHFGLDYSSSWGIMNEEHVPDEARILWDIHQVIRRQLAYDHHPEITPENRWNTGGWTVQFDDPYQTSNEPLPIINKIGELKCIN